MSSDNIDYAELDRAVNEAMRAQPKSSSSRSTAAKAKPVAVTPRPAPRPQNHGRIMDFAPRNIHSPTQVRPAQTTTATARPIVKRPAIAGWKSLLIRAIAIIAALGVSSVVLLILTKKSPLEAMKLVYEASFGVYNKTLDKGFFAQIFTGRKFTIYLHLLAARS